MVKKIISAVLTSALCISLCAGCGGKEKGSDGQINITIGGWPAETNEKSYKTYMELKENFEKKYPDIKISTDTWGFDLHTFLPKAASGQLPSVYMTSFTEISRIIKSGYAADVTELMEKYGYTKYIRDDIKNLITDNGRLYAVPEDGYIMALYINLNLFKQAGLVNSDGTPIIPKTWNDLAKTAQTIKEKTGKAGFILPSMQNCGGWHFLNIAWAYGTSPEFMIQKDGKWQANFATEECAEALQFVKDLKHKYNALPENALLDANEVMRLFATDQAAMYLASPPQDALTRTFKMSKDNIAIASMPEGPDGKFTQFGGQLRVLKKGMTDEEIDACFKWLDFIGLSPEITDVAKQSAEQLIKLRADEGALIGVKNFGYWKQDGEIAPVQEFTNSLTEKYTNVNPAMFKDFENFDKVQIRPEPPISCQQLYNILDGCIQNVLIHEDANPLELLKQAQNDFQTNYLNKAE